MVRAALCLVGIGSAANSETCVLPVRAHSHTAPRGGATPGNRAESRLNPTGVASSPPPRWHNPVGVGTRNGGRPRVAPVRRNPGLRDAIPSGLCGMRGNLWVRLRGRWRFGLVRPNVRADLR